ncbi:PTS mannitol transporter subunit IICBA [Weissella hellenica]|uniref:PTS system mannitol-specific EIICB component n=1 Tax=Weissella hellenica TaxID=46256 RepID=A0A7X6RCL7_WEIHE|nr:PTS mannitol transporter subunit IICBA [Weissella hellenica]
MSEKPKTSLKAKVQKFGTFLSGMIMPNIAAIIAWGLITAIFLSPGGWFPDAAINKMSSPALTYLLPLLIGYTGGKMVYEDRGAIVGAIATLGAIVGSDVPMFIGAMIMGPLGGWCMKKVDSLFQAKIKSGFEMIYNNFSAGIIGMLLAILAEIVVGPLVVAGSNVMAIGVDWIISVHALPLANIFIEPAKVLFLNNALGNGILVPLGIQQVTDAGKSVLFLLESNPGPGIGVLLAFSLFGKGSAKSSAPGAAIIQFFGGIHEIYFPYIMMKPSLFLAVIGGGITGTFTFQMLGAGLKAAASPGSIISILLMTPKDSYIAVLAGILSAAIVSFVIATIILKRDKSNPEDDDFANKQAQVSNMKSASKGKTLVTNGSQAMDYASVQKVIFACDAGMGSSAMGASLLRDRFKKAGLQDIPVTNVAVRNLKNENGLLVVTQEELQERAQQKAPHALSVAVQNFMNSPRYDEIVENLKDAQLGGSGAVDKQSAVVEAKEPVVNDFINVAEIQVAYDKSNAGSATMTTDILSEKINHANKQTRVKRVAIRDLQDKDGNLIVSTPKIIETLTNKYQHAQLIAIENLVDNKLNEISKNVQ